MKNRELIEKLMQFDENADIAAQVVDMQGNAWNLGLRGRTEQRYSGYPNGSPSLGEVA